MESVFCPEVLNCALKWAGCWRGARPSSVQYAAEHADSMLITSAPLTQCVSSCQLGATLWTKPFWEFECQHLLPPYFHSQLVVCVCSSVDSVSFIPFLCFLWCTIMAKPANRSVDHNLSRFCRAFLGALQAFSGVFCFVLLRRESDRVCSTGRWTEVILWACTTCSLSLTHTHTHTHKKRQLAGKVSTFSRLAKSRLEVDKSQLSSHDGATLDVDPRVCALILL